jgi:hypothetical protein
MAAEGVRNQLGRPRLSLFEVLVREAIQNSWDARVGDAVVDFRIDGRECSIAEKEAIGALLAQNLPTHGLPLLQSLRRAPLRLLVVSDRGTTGLGGPTRADIEPEKGSSHDFVAFLRNIGEPRDKEFGAGTFGFGKAIFYLVSRARTIVAFTRCRLNRGYETRLIGCGIGDSFQMQDGPIHRPYTGRHWWGVSTGELQEPLRNEEADEAARVLGLEAFGPNETGTSIVVLDPVFEQAEDDIRSIACAITWHAWPKMVLETPEMRFSVSWNHEPVDVPDPVRTPPLDAFVAAYRLLAAGELIECHRPQKLLGRLALHRQLVRTQQPDYPASFEPPIASPVHHVALLRAPHFVVRYYEGDPLPGDAAEYAGVFEADPGVDSAFAEAESPTHDDWVARQLTGQERTWVRATFTRIAERLRAFARPMTIEIVGAGGVPLGAASAQFATLVATAPASGGTSSPAGPGRNGGHGDLGHDVGAGGGGAGRDSGVGASRRSRGKTEEVGQPEYGNFDGEPAVLLAFRVRRAEAGSSVHAEASIGTDEGLHRETDAPIGSARPRLLGWVGPEEQKVRGAALPTDGRVGQLWRVAVAPVPDTVTTVALRLQGPEA